MTLHGETVPLDGVDHIRRARAWLEDHPDDRAAEMELQAWLQARVDAETNTPLEDWTWDGSGEAELPRTWLVNNWLPANRIALLSGAPGGGKTFLALQLAAGIASGGGEGDAWIDAQHDVLRLGTGAATQGQTVVFASWQDEPDELKRRLSWISGPDAPWVDPYRLKDTLRFPMVRQRGGLWKPTGYEQAGITPAGEELRRYCLEHSARLLIIDTLADAYYGNENSRGMVTNFSQRLGLLGRVHRLRHPDARAPAEERGHLLRHHRLAGQREGLLEPGTGTAGTTAPRTGPAARRTAPGLEAREPQGQLQARGIGSLPHGAGRPFPRSPLAGSRAMGSTAAGGHCQLQRHERDGRK